MRNGTLKPMGLVKTVREAESAASKPLKLTRGDALLGLWQKLVAKNLMRRIRTPIHAAMTKE